MDKRTDQEIIEAIVAGDKEAFRIIVERYADQLINLCYRYLFREEESQDATQEIFIKAYHHLNEWKPRAQFKTWLYRIAINHCLNLLRRRKIIQFQSLQETKKLHSEFPKAREEDSDNQLIKHQQEMQLKSYINQLPENQKSVIILYFYQEFSYKEISETLGISLSSVESRLFRAKKKLAKIITREKRK